MQIQRVEASYHNVPVRVPLLDEPEQRDLVFVRVATDDGATGYGLAGSILGPSVVEFINRELGPFLRGRDPLLTEQWWHEAYWKFNQRSLSGVVSSGLSGVDIALWDLKGRALAQPVWRLLGGYAARVPAYITFGLPNYSREQLVEVAKSHVADGHDKLKMVVARVGSVREDAARVRAVREAVGDGVQLMLDANHLFSPLEATELCRLVEPYGISWFEEPLAGNDVLKLAELRRQTSIPISAGQNEGHRWRHRELIVSGAVDIVQPNVLFVGGYTEALKVAHLAQCFNLPIANGGGWPHHNAHLMGAVANGWRVEFHMIMWFVGDTIFDGAPRPEAGWVTLPERPGLGFEPKEDALREYRVRPD
jgi:L-alanine-DL-glutamate epimerase-like enolase superfamily enzyme